MGEVRVPKDAYYAAQTQRAIENFPISGIGFPAQEALATGQSIRTLAQQKNLMAKEQLERVLDPWSMTEPGIAGRSE